MGRAIEISGDRLSLFLYGLQLIGILLALLFVALPLDSPADIPLAVLFVLIVGVTAVGLWRRANGGDGAEHLGTAEDITYDPFADPGQAARDRWEKAVNRLPGGDDERD